MNVCLLPFLTLQLPYQLKRATYTSVSSLVLLCQVLHVSQLATLFIATPETTMKHALRQSAYSKNVVFGVATKGVTRLRPVNTVHIRAETIALMCCVLTGLFGALSPFQQG